MSGAQKQQPSFANVKAPEGKGYYNALGLEFDCTPTGAARTSPLGHQSPCAAAAAWRRLLFMIPAALAAANVVQCDRGPPRGCRARANPGSDDPYPGP